MDETLKPCPFCGGSWVITHRPANGSQPYISCKECNASGPLTAGMTEAQWRAAWNTRADTAPTPKADEVEAVARAVHGELSHIDVMKYLDMPDNTADRVAQAAIAALDAARGDPVARVVEWLRAMKRDDTNWPQHIAFLIERGEPFNG